MTKSTGVGRGGRRAGAGRKASAPPDLAEAEALAGKTVEELMELAVRMAARKGRWDEVSKAGARLLNAQRRAAGKAAADGPPPAPRFAPRPPPPKPN